MTRADGPLSFLTLIGQAFSSVAEHPLYMQTFSGSIPGTRAQGSQVDHDRKALSQPKTEQSCW